MSKESYFSFVLGFGAIIWAVVQGMYPVISPIVGWPIVGGLGIRAIFFLIIGIRKKKSQMSLILTPRTYAIGLSGMTGYPNKPDGAYWLRLEASVNAAYNKPIDTLDLLIGAATIHANSWPGRKVAAFTVYFNITDWKWKGESQVELQARMQGAVHSSGRISIDFDAEPGGFPRYL